MIPVTCRVKHDPPHSYGDCFRACVASIMEMNAEAVPHFFETGPHAVDASQKLNEWLAQFGLTPFYTGYDGTVALIELLDMIGSSNKGHYILNGRTADGGDHVVVCRGDKVVHNPGWFPTPIVECNSMGIWSIIVIAKL